MGERIVKPVAPSRRERMGAWVAWSVVAAALVVVALLLIPTTSGAGLLMVLLKKVGLSDGYLPELIVMASVGAGVVQFAGRRTARRRARRLGYRVCTQCHYHLKGLGDECDCPECGAYFELTQAAMLWGARNSPPEPASREARRQRKK